LAWRVAAQPPARIASASEAIVGALNIAASGTLP
jgi:hypothetical protein